MDEAMNETADSIMNNARPISSEDNNKNCYLTNNMQTMVSEVITEASQKGNVSITDLIHWLFDIKVLVTMDDIKQIVQQYLKGRFKVVNEQICAVEDERALLEARHQGIYCQDAPVNMEKNVNG